MGESAGAAGGPREPPWLSVIVPTLDEARCIEPTLQAILSLPCRPEVIVVDGGSADRTVALARQQGVQVLRAPRGRGSQMHAGARVARGEVLWFLHADTHPPADACGRIAAALRDDPAVVGGNFEIRFDGSFRAARFLTWLYHYLSLIGLRYGDSGYFVRRDAYHTVGGFRPYPIFEDLDLLRRLQPIGRFVRLPATVTTSSRRFEGRSFGRTFAHWTWLQILYWLGVSPERLGSGYAHIRLPHVRRRAGASHLQDDPVLPRGPLQDLDGLP